MAEEQKNVEVPVTQETKPESTALPVVAPEVPAVDSTKPAEETPVETAPVAETKVDETKPAETTEEAPKAEEKKEEEEVKPIEEGHLGHKATGLSFPKNLIASKEFFFFGSEAVEPKFLSHYLRSEKSAATAHGNIAWASHTGEGLLFVGDKKTPSSVINLADATEPETDGSNKFHFTSKGNKHSFKASSTAERDNWVAQLKLKIAAAKDLAATVTESETYKSTIESFKPAPIAKKEEKPVETPKEEAKTEEAVPAVVVPTVETPKEEEVVEERKKEEVKSEEPKRRSASRKRASFFGFGKKEEKKVEEKKEETKPAEETPAVEAPVAETTTETVAPVVPVVETEAPKTEEVAPVTEAAPATEEAKPAEETPVESPKEKPATGKRNSFFGGVFSKKEKKSPEIKPTEPTEAPKDDAAETAPVIPPVEATTPLAVDVSSPATVPVETTEAPAATNGEPKKDIKEKRKSSLPFAFGKREKSPAPSPSEEKKASPFSKLRATIKGKAAAPKSEEKPAEETKAEDAVKEEETKTEETPKVEAPKEDEPAKATEPEGEVKPENVATTTPAVTAAA